MKRKPQLGRGSVLTALLALMFALSPAWAGPPLICHPIAIGDAKSLPWVSETWRLTGAEHYDINHLPDDTLNLLTPSMPVIVRMETLRRATLYAQQNRWVGKELLLKLRSRALDGGAKGKPDALALFDLGYFVECLKQANMTFRREGPDSYVPVYQPNVASQMDGLAWVEKAIELRRGDPELEFAAALITSFPRPDVSRSALQKMQEEHLRRAVEGATEGTLLSRNLVEHFSERGKTLAELHANLGGGR